MSHKELLFQAPQYESLYGPVLGPMQMHLLRFSEIRTRCLRKPLKLSPGERQFVIYSSGLIALNKDITYKGGHADLARLHPVIAAGNIRFASVHGVLQIVEIDNWSGHYKPHADSIPIAIEALRLARFPLSPNIEQNTRKWGRRF